MKRKYFFGIVIALIICLIVAISVLFFIIENSNKEINHNFEQLNPSSSDNSSDKNDAHDNVDEATITGIIVRTDHLLILENPSQWFSLCSISTARNPVVYVDGKVSALTDLRLGQTVKVTFSGQIAESYPSIALGVTKICATTDVAISTLEGNIIEIEKDTLIVQEDGNPNNTHTLSISEDTFVCIQGMNANIQGLNVGQHVELAYKKDTEGEFPKATIICVKPKA